MFFDNLEDDVMKVRTFREKVAARIAEVNSCVCLGLDSDWEKLPSCLKSAGFEGGLLRFNADLIDATHDLLLAVKLNAAFYEKHGEAGKKALQWTIGYCAEKAPNVIRIVDYKRADIGNSNQGYVTEAFECFKADAATVNPYFGQEAMQPFLDRRDKGIIILCRTSNPGGDEFQNLLVKPPGWTTDLQDVFGDRRTMPLYEYVAFQVVKYWNQHDNCALVVGGTCPDELENVRKIAPFMPLLIPGLGAQGATAAEVVPVARDSQGGGMIINSSRGIIFASADTDFADAARRKTLELRDEINQYRRAV